MRSALILALAALVLTSCVAPSGGPRKLRPSATAPSDAQTRQCLADLTALRVSYSALPDQDFGNGCSILGSVQLSALPTPVSNVKAVRCPLARAIALWMRDDVQPAAREHLSASVSRLNAMGAYACRRINGAATGRLSEHASANALDIGGFTLSDGRKVTVLTGWNGVAEEQRFLRDVRASACKRFKTVLSPDYNAAHYDHLHFDMGRGPFCR